MMNFKHLINILTEYNYNPFSRVAKMFNLGNARSTTTV
jgi:hypothetical protein